MNASYFFSLYWRNIKGTFIGGFNLPFMYGTPFVWLGHIALLPLSLTLFAGIKTIIDVSTRKYTYDKKILTSTYDSISKMTNEQMGQLAAELDNKPASCMGNKYASNSSRWLFERLSSDEQMVTSQNKLNEEQYMDAIQDLRWQPYRDAIQDLKRQPYTAGGEILTEDEVKKRYNSEYLKAHADKHFRRGVETDSCFEDESRNNYILYRTDKAGFKNSKQFLLNYMHDPKNNGKDLFQRVITFFTKPFNLNSRPAETKTLLDKESSIIMTR